VLYSLAARAQDGALSDQIHLPGRWRFFGRMVTTLGSCVAAFIRDPKAGVGGMNHFLLPESPGAEGLVSLRYGAFAMELLINGLLNKGAGKTAYNPSRQLCDVRFFGVGSVPHTLTHSENKHESTLPVHRAAAGSARCEDSAPARAVKGRQQHIPEPCELWPTRPGQSPRSLPKTGVGRVTGPAEIYISVPSHQLGRVSIFDWLQSSPCRPPTLAKTLPFFRNGLACKAF
jgi:hypothetical protein